MVVLPLAANLPSDEPLTGAALFRVLGDDDRLRLLALCALEELTVSEIATILDTPQPQVTRKSQPLRDLHLLHNRRDGARTFLSTRQSDDAVVASAIRIGHALLERDGALSTLKRVVLEREAHSRQFFDASSTPAVQVDTGAAFLQLLPLLKTVVEPRLLAIDVGAGDGALLPVLSGIYERVIAVDRSAAQLARCQATVVAQNLPNVRLFQGEVDDANLYEEVALRGGAALVVMARVLHHQARPRDAVAAAARLLAKGGSLCVVDDLPHTNEAMREEGDVWLGLSPDVVAGFANESGLRVVAQTLLPAVQAPNVLPRFVLIARREPAP